MSFPSNFPATRNGYKSYIKSIGLDPNSPNNCLWAITENEFMSIDRKTLEERILDSLDQYENLMLLNNLDNTSNTYILCDILSNLYNSILNIPDRDIFIRLAKKNIDILEGDNYKKIVNGYINEIINNES